MWAYEILVEEGLRYSSSVFPFPGRQYGIGDHPIGPVRIATASGELVEMPLSVIEIAGRRLPIAGGGFWRATPRLAIDLAVRAVTREGRALVLYLHPHEFDPQPLRSSHGIARDIYVNLGRSSISGKLANILKRFPFVPLSAVVAALGEIPTVAAVCDRRQS